MDFIAGLIIGTILMMGITTLKLSNKAINNNIDTQPEFRPIATQLAAMSQKTIDSVDGRDKGDTE